jgi:hypothetical protein
LGISLIVVIFMLVIVVILVIVILANVNSGRRQGPASGPAVAPPGWLADPMQRHQYRFWDGVQWTAAVSDNGAQANDPV